MRIIIPILIILHGVIHLLGFLKAYHLATVNQLTQSISRVNGLLWLITSILFVTSAFMIYLKADLWWTLSILAVALSQYLIFSSWQDAKFGTIANGVILIATIIGFGGWNFNHIYQTELTNALKLSDVNTSELLTEADILPLPVPVRKYLHYTGSVGKPKVQHFKVAFFGDFRQSEGSEWMPFSSEQFNSVKNTTRLFFMKATMNHLPVSGFHCFKEGNASMDIRLLSLFKVQYQSGDEMNVSETVTFFNDMCVMAPATLIDPRIQWLHADGNTVEASFTDNNITITARLFFNEEGEMVDFVSNDRYATTRSGELVKAPWSTPLKDYNMVNGYRLATYAETIYDLPEGRLCYGKFHLKEITYNNH